MSPTLSVLETESSKIKQRLHRIEPLILKTGWSDLPIRDKLVCRPNRGLSGARLSIEHIDTRQYNLCRFVGKCFAMLSWQK